VSPAGRPIPPPSSRIPPSTGGGIPPPARSPCPLFGTGSSIVSPGDSRAVLRGVETAAHAGKADKARAKEIRLYTRGNEMALVERRSGGRIWSVAHFAIFLSAPFFYFGRFPLFRKAGSPAPSLKRVPVLRCKPQGIGFLRYLSLRHPFVLRGRKRNGGTENFFAGTASKQRWGRGPSGTRSCWR
jgi:hypothetical protein